MPRLVNKSPKYSRKKRKYGNDRATVTIDGKKIDLGVYGSDSSWEAYHEVVQGRRRPQDNQDQREAGFEANGGQDSGDSELNGSQSRTEEEHQFPTGTVGNMLEKFVAYTDERLTTTDRKTGLIKPNREAEQVRQICELAIGSQQTNYGMLHPDAFTGPRLKAFRKDLIQTVHVSTSGRETRWNRGHVAEMVNKLRRAFKWATTEDLVEMNTYLKLKAINPLRVRESGVLEPKEKDIVDDDVVAQTLPLLTTVLAHMVMVLRYTGMRSNEMCILEWCDIDETDDVWWYKPSESKKTWLGKARDVPIGPQCQEILNQYRHKQGYLFSPKDSEEERRKGIAANRKTPVRASNCRGARKKSNPEIAPGECFEPNSFRQAIRSRCERG